MANLTVQRLIYKASIKSPSANRVLDRFGNGLNRALKAVHLSMEYATGLTRNKAVMFASQDRFEVNNAEVSLLATGRDRAYQAVLEKRGFDFDPRRDLLQCYVPNPRKTLNSLLAAGFSEKKAAFISAMILKKTEWPFEQVFDLLSARLPEIRRTLSADATYKLVVDVIRNTRLSVYPAIDILPSLVKSKFSHSQIIRLYTPVVAYKYPDAINLIRAASSIRRLGEASLILRERMQPDEAYGVLASTLRRVKRCHDLALHFLPDFIHAGCSRERAIDTCVEITSSGKYEMEVERDFYNRLYELYAKRRASAQSLHPAT